MPHAVPSSVIKCINITQLAHKCRDVNMGFQKLETISSDLMYADNTNVVFPSKVT